MRQYKYVAFDAALANTGGHWGTLDENGIVPEVSFLFKTAKSKDPKKSAVVDFIDRCAHLLRCVDGVLASQKPHFVFIESPVGSQSAKAAQGAAAICMMIAHIQLDGQDVITCTPMEVKKATGLPGNPEKRDIIDWAYGEYPNLHWSWHAGRIKNEEEHKADSLAVALAGHKKIKWEAR